MKLLPLTTCKQLLNPHRVGHQVSKSTHLCMITQEDNKWCNEKKNECDARLPNMEHQAKESALGWNSKDRMAMSSFLPVNDNRI